MTPQRTDMRRIPAWPTRVVLAAVALAAAITIGGRSAAAWDARAGSGEPGGDDIEVSALLERARHAESLWTDVEGYYRAELAPIERVLLRHRPDPALARRIALALVREGNASGLDPRLLLAVLLVENPWLDTKARSFVGAVGLMQVMPFHEGEWDSCAPDLEDIDANICHGARIFAHYLRTEGGDVERALLRYNGCVRGTNTPDCHRYPHHVYARAGHASIVAWIGATMDGSESWTGRPASASAAAP